MKREQIFSKVMSALRAAVKNSALYAPGHPVFDSSVGKLKGALEEWFAAGDRMDLGFSPDNILLDGEYVDEKSPAYGDVAGYFHARGVTSLSFLRGVGEKELSGLFSFLKNDVRTVRQRGGVAKNVLPSPHLEIREIDYGALLAAEGGAAAEADTWKALSRTAEESAAGPLPESKAEFLRDFLRDPAASASALNGAYREAAGTQRGDEVAADIERAVRRVWEYFRGAPGGGEEEASRSIADIVGRLDPALTAKLVERVSAAGGAPGAASDFISRVCAAALDAFAEAKAAAPPALERLGPLINEYKRLLDAGGLKKEEAALLVNILWLEDDGVEFKKFGSRLADALPAVLDFKDTKVIKKIFELFLEGLRPEQRRERMIDEAAKEALKVVTSGKVINTVISFIPKADGEALEDISYIMVKTKSASAVPLIDAFVFETDVSHRERFGLVLSEIAGEAAGEIAKRIEYCEPAAAKHLFGILKAADPKKAHELIKGIVASGASKLRAEALEAFDPETDAERESVFAILRSEKDDAVTDGAVAALLRSGDGKTVERLFGYARLRFWRRGLMQKLVEACGELRAERALPRLERILLKRPLIGTKASDELRIAAAVSLKKLGTPEAMEAVERCTADKRDAVRKMCRLIARFEE